MGTIKAGLKSTKTKENYRKQQVKQRSGGTAEAGQLLGSNIIINHGHHKSVVDTFLLYKKLASTSIYSTLFSPLKMGGQREL